VGETGGERAERHERSLVAFALEPPSPLLERLLVAAPHVHGFSEDRDADPGHEHERDLRQREPLDPIRQQETRRDDKPADPSGEVGDRPGGVDPDAVHGDELRCVRGANRLVPTSSRAK
jgi:hypothetical protein